MASTWSLNKQRPRSSRPDGRVLHILVVEDDPDCAECLALLLRVEGIAVEIATTGLGALASIQTSRPDVVLMDIGLPDMNGYQVVRCLREEGTKLPLLVALTGSLEDSAPSHAAQEHFDYHLLKPIDPASILALLNEYARSL